MKKNIYKNLSFNEIQLDEHWGFVFKKQYNLSETERLSDEIGDIWTFTAVLPVEKLILAHITGKRTSVNARKLLTKVKTRSKPKREDKFLITSDGYEGYSDAILSVYGKFDSMTRKLQSPKSLCYGQIIKRIEKGRCKEVDKSLIFGDQKLLDEYIANSSVSHQMNTFAVERNNLTLRQHNHRIERKSQGFSKKFKYMQGHNSFVANYYNFCLPHSSLAEYEGGKPIQITPAMATEMTNHKWSIQELFIANRNFD